MQASSSTGSPSSEFVQRLVDHGSDLGRQLQRAMPLTLETYLGRLFEDLPPAAAGPLRIFTEAMHRSLTARGQHDADDICAEFCRRPVLQQADHANLLLDAETFANNYLFHLAAAGAGGRAAVTSQCSTVVCFSRRQPPHGPVFLYSRGALFDVYGRSKTRYKNANFCSLTGPVEMKFQVLDGAWPTGDPVLARLAGRRFGDPATAYRVCNDEIWRMLRIDDRVARIQIDEATTSEAIALHLEDPASPVHRLFFDPALRRVFLETKRELVASGHNIAINRAVPDWIWWRRGERLHAVVLDDPRGRPAARLETDGSALPVPWTSRDLAVALRAGDVYGDRVISYLAREEGGKHGGGHPATSETTLGAEPLRCASR